MPPSEATIAAPCRSGKALPLPLAGRKESDPAYRATEKKGGNRFFMFEIYPVI
jgi:hypothetical protein